VGSWSLSQNLSKMNFKTTNWKEIGEFRSSRLCREHRTTRESARSLQLSALKTLRDLISKIGVHWRLARNAEFGRPRKSVFPKSGCKPSRTTVSVVSHDQFKERIALARLGAFSRATRARKLLGTLTEAAAGADPTWPAFPFSLPACHSR